MPDLLDLVHKDLKDSSGAWNRKDIDAMCGYYAPDARYLSSKGLIVGRDNIAAVYKKAYPDPDAMGTLKLELEDFVPRTLTATVRWTLQDAEGEEKSGLCTLVYELRGDELRVVYDNSR